jgi:alkylated DNA repair dioxygenase AlkB
VIEEHLDGRVVLHRAHFPATRAAELYARLEQETRWLQVTYDNAGRAARMPRLTVNYGERSYDYGGLVFAPEPWTPLLQELRAEAERLAATGFNALILQLYRDGRDGVRWHADDSPAVGRDPVIASLSFGADRRFQLRRVGETAAALELTLRAGDLLVMGGDLQHTYQHRVPREPAAAGPRINLTFRTIVDAHRVEAVPHTKSAAPPGR